MDKELNNNLPEDNSWLDDILGTGNIAKELGADELAMQAAGLTHPEDLELESILAEDWGDPEPLEMPLPLSMEEDLAAETLFDEVSDMEQLDIPTDQKAPEEGQENLLPEETEASDLLPSAEEISEPETDDKLIVAAVVGEVSEEMDFEGRYPQSSQFAKEIEDELKNGSLQKEEAYIKILERKLGEVKNKPSDNGKDNLSIDKEFSTIVIQEYLKKIMQGKSKTKVFSGVSLSMPPLKPTTVAEASALAKNYIKRKGV